MTCHRHQSLGGGGAPTHGHPQAAVMHQERLVGTENVSGFAEVEVESATVSIITGAEVHGMCDRIAAMIDHVMRGNVKKGLVMTGPGMSDHVMRGHAMKGCVMTDHVTIGHEMTGRVMTDLVMTGPEMIGHVKTGHAVRGHVMTVLEMIDCEMKNLESLSVVKRVGATVTDAALSTASMGTGLESIAPHMTIEHHRGKNVPTHLQLGTTTDELHCICSVPCLLFFSCA